VSKKHHDHEEHEEHVNHEAWVIPYADMLTLLMALFLVLFAIGRTDAEKFKALAGSLHEAIVGASPGGDKVPTGVSAGGSESVLDGQRTVVPDLVPDTVPPGQEQTTKAALAQLQQQQEAVTATIKDLSGVELQVKSAAAQAGVGDKLNFRLEGRGLVVTIVTDQVVFQPGQAELGADGAKILDIIAASLVDSDYDLAIEGHTDSRPISTTRYPSNWELSTARATTVLRYLVDAHGFSPDRLTASGYADTKPIALGTGEADLAKNRRVEIVVLSDVILTPATGTTGTATP
jgi:chemotaxis protein MotB